MDPRDLGRASRARTWLAVAVVTILLAGCGDAPPTGTFSASPLPLPSGRPSASAAPSAAAPPTTAVPSTGRADPFVGRVVVTVSEDLRVRSKPRVADDSIKYEPLLPLGTELKVIGGPENGSGYTWYEIIPVDVTLDGAPRSGWVAAAAKDGTPWIALPGSQVAGAELAISSVARAPADPARAKEAAASIMAFGLDLYGAMLADPRLGLADKNAVFSPTSIALALGMARAGAKGETATQMDAILHTTGWEAFGPGLNSLDQELATRNATWSDPYLDPPTRQIALRVANASFAQSDWLIERAYLDAIARVFGAGLRLVDYRSDVESARKTINAWVSDRTEKRIPELIPGGTLDELTRLVLVNAIYLKAAWAHPFPAGDTKRLPFIRLNGSQTTVDTMFQSGGQQIPYGRGNGWRAAELRYESQGPAALAMILIIPDDLPSFEQGLTASQLGRIATTLEAERARLRQETFGDWSTNDPCECGCYPYSVDLFMPRFGIDTQASLADALHTLGMPLALTRGQADFSGIHVPKSYPERLYIQAVIHEANIDVDEEGTEAAAATAVAMGETGGGCVGAVPHPLRTITLRLDHPFLFVLRDVETGAILFMGRVIDPSVGG